MVVLDFLARKAPPKSKESGIVGNAFGCVYLEFDPCVRRILKSAHEYRLISRLDSKLHAFRPCHSIPVQVGSGWVVCVRAMIDPYSKSVIDALRSQLQASHQAHTHLVS